MVRFDTALGVLAPCGDRFGAYLGIDNLGFRGLGVSGFRGLGFRV